MGGVTGDTKIYVADNRNITVEELMNELNSGKENFCFSLDNNCNVVIDKIEEVRQIKTVSELLIITLDNYETIYCDLNCNFISRDNNTIKAKNLIINQSLAPLYIDYAKNVPIGSEDYKRHVNLEDYLVVFNPSSELYNLIHSIADAYNLRNGIYTKKDGPIRHHDNFVKYNNNPPNIKRKYPIDHLKLHSEVGSVNMKKLHQDPKFQERHRKRASQNISEYLKSDEFFEMTRDAGQRGKEYLIKYNKSDKGRKKSSEIGREGRMKCHICGEEFFGRAENNEHYKKKHPKIWAEWQDNLHNASLEYVRSEEGRNAQSERVKSGKMECHKCGKIIYGASELKKHYAEEHNDPMPCPFCGNLYKGRGGLGTHVRFCPESPELSGHIIKGHTNHKIVNIIIIKSEPTIIYNLKLNEFGCFGLAAGIFIMSS